MKEKKRKEKKMTGLTVRKGRGWESIVKSRNAKEIELTMVVIVSW